MTPMPEPNTHDADCPSLPAQMHVPYMCTCGRTPMPEPRTQSEDHELVREITAVVRKADKEYGAEGGSSRHWVRDHFLPLLNDAGFEVGRRD